MTGLGAAQPCTGSQAASIRRASLEASQHDCAALIDKMIRALVAADMLYAITHQEWDGDDAVGEEQAYDHPDFERRYRLWRAEQPR